MPMPKHFHHDAAVKSSVQLRRRLPLQDLPNMYLKVPRGRIPLVHTKCSMKPPLKKSKKISCRSSADPYLQMQSMGLMEPSSDPEEGERCM